MKLKRFFAIIISALMLLSLTSCGGKEIPDSEGWYAAWASAQLAAGINETPIKPPLKENTVRQQIRANIGGNKIKLTLSNEHGDIPAQIESVHLAHLLDPTDNAIDLSTDVKITFGGSESVDIPAGQTVTSDEIDFEFEALDDLAVTMKFGKYAGSTPTSHTGARCSTWIISGDHVADESFEAEEVMTSWYFISELDVWAEAGTRTLVLLGDSITDGYGTTTNQFERWSDEMNRLYSQLLQLGESQIHVAQGLDNHHQPVILQVQRRCHQLLVVLPGDVAPAVVEQRGLHTVRCDRDFRLPVHGPAKSAHSK